MKIVIVGGDFSENSEGRPSKLINIIAQTAQANPDVKEVSLFNGGEYCTLLDIIDLCESSDVIMWFPRVSNDLDKVRDIKRRYPNKMLVTSKANFEGKYKLKDIVAHALMLKSNLLVEFVWGMSDTVFARLVDPLGCVWKDFTPRMDNLTNKIVERAKQLMQIQRFPSIKIGEAQVPPVEKAWLDIVRDMGDKFHKIINPSENITRFLGNTSFRCESGFPSFKVTEEEIYISRRNVDKRTLDENSFVRVKLGIDGAAEYWGDDKPSVDAPVQLRLYRFLPKIKYMLHGHVYAKGCPFTKVPIPCGGIQEVDEVMKVVNSFGSPFAFKEGAVNLIGHGCLAMSNRVEYFNTLEFYGRPNGEIMERYYAV